MHKAWAAGALFISQWAKQRIGACREWIEIVRGRTEGMMAVDQCFANYCPSIKLIDTGDRQPDGI